MARIATSLGTEENFLISPPISESKAAIDDSNDFNCSRYWRIIREKLDEASTIPKEFLAVC